MTSAQSYFGGLAAEQRKLSSHGFAKFPSEEETLDYLFDVADKVDALYAALGMTASRDPRGTWRAAPAREEVR